ncbi:MAG: hypothetical protein IJD01_08390 [Clostridia bacterium]|nr:hypothetical protein [Clostridia bacterium]
MKKRMYRATALLAAAVLCTVLFLTACGSGKVTYSVTVKDALDNPYTTGIVVKFLQNGEQVAMQPCNESGVAEKVLDPGEYTVELAFTDSEAAYHYTQEGLTVTEKAPSLTIVMAKTVSGDPEVLSVGGGEYDAYSVEEGCTYAELVSGKRNYFLFAPTRAGSYAFSVPEGKNVTVGYYGAPHFVQEHSAAEVVDNVCTVSVSADMIGTDGAGTSVYVIGLDAADDVTSAVLGIERVGDPVKTLADEPWTIYETTATLADYTLPAGATIEEFDLTASTDTYKLVYNETDGFYHLNTTDGPLVLVRLAEDCDYIACFKTMLDRSGVTKYFFDENDEFVKKESYSECLLEYIEYVDEAEGVYPLTEDLKYIIKQRGGYVGWWDAESNGYIFKDENGNNDLTINTEIAWLLMCCYVA